MLRKKNRISSKLLISKLFKKGNLYQSRCLNFRYLPSLNKVSQFAVIVSGKRCKKAVDRNHFKRRISEALRVQQEKIPSPVVCLILPRTNPQEADQAHLEKGIIDFSEHLRLNDKELKTASSNA